MAKALRLAGMRAISNGALNMVSLPTRLKVLDWGLNKTLKGDVVVDDKTVQIFAENQARVGRERAPIDFDHNSVRGTDAHEDLKGRPPTIFGYGTPTIIPGDGIYFENIIWTPDGEANARNFHDLSPTPLLDEDNRVLAIHSCALTPAGAVEGLTFYSAFDNLKDAYKSLYLDSVPNAYKETRQLPEHQGLCKKGSMNKEHFDYFRKAFKLSPESADEDVKKHVLKAFAARMLEADADADMGVKHLAAMFGHVKSDPDPNNPPHMNQFPSEGGPVYHNMVAELSKSFESKLAPLNAEIAELKKQKEEGDKAAENAHKASIVSKATSEGKVIPMSAEMIALTPIKALEEMVSKLEKSVVPVTRKGLKPLNADGKPPKPNRQAGVDFINSHVAIDR